MDSVGNGFNVDSKYNGICIQCIIHSKYNEIQHIMGFNIGWIRNRLDSHDRNRISLIYSNQ